MNIKKAYGYDDVLLVPQHSTVKSRSDISLRVEWFGDTAKSPVIPANMKDVVDEHVASKLLSAGCVVFLHRFGKDPVDEQVKIIRHLRKNSIDLSLLGASIGVQSSDRDGVVKLLSAGFKNIMIDVAHGDSDASIEMVEHLTASQRGITVTAGNVCTREAAGRLFKAGAHAVKVGVGPGSICTTRLETGNGVPQLTALEDVSKLRNDFFPDRKIIADGGIKSAGDAVKALCFADFVMIGKLFAQCKDSPADEVIDGHDILKRYSGSSTFKPVRSEGARIDLPVHKNIVTLLQHLHEGIQSGCSYQGCRDLKSLQDNPVWVEVSSQQASLDFDKVTAR